MNPEATQDNAATAGLAGSNLKKVQKLRSLAISPNLDKLLEHEEWLRMTTMPMNSTECSLTEVEQPSSTSSTLLTGLPPPPRRNRQPPSRAGLQRVLPPVPEMLSAVVEQEDALMTSTPTQSPSQRNPYINPAPTAEELFRSRDSVRPPSHQSSLPFQHNPSVCRNDTDTSAICFKVETPKKGKFPGSPTLGQRSTKLIKKHHHAKRDSLISHGQTLEDSAIARFASSSVDFQARIGISRTVNRTSVLGDHCCTLPDNPLDSTANRMSFIEIYSQTNTRSNLEHPSPRAMSDSSPDPTSHPVISKPPLPTTPKPVFIRRASLLMKQSSPRCSLPQEGTDVKPMTTNLLDLDERAELVRKSRKLARVFGETPNAESVVNHDNARSAIRRKGLESDTQTKLCRERTTPERPSTHARRYSLPLSADDVSFVSISSAFEDDNLLSSSLPPLSSRTLQSSVHEESTPIKSHSPCDDSSSAVDNASPIQSLETTTLEDRRRRRDRLAKLHWFLGSKVPINLVLGLPDDTAEASLPPVQQAPSQSRGIDVDETRKLWAKPRRSKSVILGHSSRGLERSKADLDEKEKAIIVRRAQKMEKVFGVAPPIALYHTSTTLPSLRARSAPSSSFPSSLDLPSAFSPSRVQKKKESRPITPESSKHLLKSKSSLSSLDRSLANEPSNTSNSSSDCHGHSFYYSHYAQSLNSLSDIIDRDDVASLAELRQVLSNNTSTSVCSSQSHDGDDATTPIQSDDASVATLLISGRDNSLPARTSMTSLNSEDSIALPSPRMDAGSFQQRRKKAAKLTQFFGVDYRELIDDVLESIENGMHVDQRNGMLRAEEIEDLLQKLRKLRRKRQSFV